MTQIFWHFNLQGGIPIFMHISDIEGEYIPRKNDRVKYRICPMPPRFDRAQVRSTLLQALAVGPRLTV